ncbi:amino acid adenylation domain-containing protein [Streptomyces rimosus]|uniref:amino acid adenylation domain-containing protein n=1 Tax=Streptomyces rimosus TaxID=1927 RepID=UPI0033D86690
MTARIEPGLPLTAAQTEIWFDEQFADGDLAYNMADHFDLRGPLDPARLEEALRLALDEAECFRVRLTESDGEPRQTVEPLENLPYTTVDLSGADDPQEAARAWMARDLDRPIDVTSFPLMRAALLTLGPDHAYLYLCAHHIVSDSFVRPLFYRRLADLYTALHEGRPTGEGQLPPLKTLVDDEIAYASSRRAERDRAYWARTYADAPDPVSFAGREPVHARGFLRRSTTLPRPVVQRLRALAGRAEVTWPTLVIAAAAAYTQRLTGADEILLTLPVNARTSAAGRSVPGMVANYLPLRVAVAPGTTPENLLRTVADALLRTLRHQRYRGDRVRRDMGLRADDRRPFGPFVNVLPPEPELAFGPCPATLTNLSTGIVNDFMFSVSDSSGDDVEIHLNANPELYSAADLDAHRDRFTAFLTALSEAAPDRPLAGVGVLTEAESRRLLVEWNATERGGGFAGVVERVRQHASVRPDAIAVADGEVRVSYGALAVWADGVAGRLAEAGAGLGSLVAVLGEPGARYVGGVLGVLGAGAAWLPLDVDAPIARQTGLLADSGARFLLAGPGQVARAEEIVAADGSGVRVLVLDDPFPAVGARAEGLRPLAGGEDDLAYVIYTSGSTGRPKGAMVHRRGMVNHLLAKVEDLAMTQGDVLVHNAPVTFDISVWQMLAALVAGGTTRVVDRVVAADPDALFDVTVSEGVSVLEVVPSLLRAALDAWETAGGFPSLPKLRYLVVTGEALPVDVCRRWFARYPGIPLVNAYGPTECSDDVTHAVLDASSELGARTPIGRVVRNTRLYVLDDALRPVPVGVAGELYVAGTGVGRGYLADPARTASTFMADPFGPPGERMYRTGDRVVYRPDGQLEFLERRDHQVKIRGRRIELGEIEAALRAVEGVTDAAAQVHTDAATGRKRLVGYLVGPAGADQVRADLAEVLPEYMIPGEFVALDALPLTPNGKVDRKALTAPETTAPTSAGRAPRTPQEEILCAAFAEVLNLPSVAADADFFALGGDSISSIQVVSRARKAGLVFAPRDVFLRKTPAALATAAQAAQDAAAVVGTDDGVGELEIMPIAHQLREDGGPVAGPVGSFAQYVVVRVPDHVDSERLARALHAVTDRHDALRMQLDVPVEGLWTLKVRPQGSTDLTGAVSEVAVPADADGDAVVVEQAAVAQRRLDPTAGHLVQAVLLNAGPERPRRLLLMVHHLAVDGVSWRVLLPDLAAAWSAVEADRTPELAPVGTSYRSWSRLLADEARTAARTAELPLWTGHASAPDPLPGTRGLDAARDTYATARRLRLVLPAEQTAALLTEVAPAFHAEINDVLLTGLALAVADWRRRKNAAGDGTTDTLIELEGHGREQVVDNTDLSRTVGWFTSAFPVRLAPGELDWDEVWAGGDAVGTAFKRIKEQLRALPDHGLGYGLLRYLNPQTSALLARHPRPRIGFNYMGRFGAAGAADWSLSGEGAAVGTAAAPEMPLQHVLEVTPVTEDRPDGPHLVADWLWAGEILPDEDARDIARTWFRALELLVTHAARPGAGGRVPSDLPLVSVTQDELDAYEAELSGPGLADVLPLAPLQKGLLFLSEYERDGDGVDAYVLQLGLELGGDVDAARLRAACAQLLHRHPNLRATFRHRESGAPVQLVPSVVEVPWRETDLSTESDAAAAVARLADDERARRFDLSDPAQAPLMRFVLARTGPDRHRFLWTIHHSLVDGWSMPLLVKELFTLYAADAGTPAPPEPAPYRDYLAWLAEQDTEAALAAWKEALHGVEEPTLAAPEGAGRAAVHADTVTLPVPEPLATGLAAWARDRGLTLNTVFQGCWALLLGSLTGRDDIVFGAVTSGRPAEVPGVESMIGLFLNTVPVRVRPRPEETVAGLLAGIQERQSALMPYEHVGLAEIQNRAGIGDLFDTVLLFENFPLDEESVRASATGLRLLEAEARDGRHYPLSLAVLPGPGHRLDLRFDYAPDLFTQDAVKRLGSRLLHLLAAVPATADRPLAALGLVDEAESRRLLVEWNATERGGGFAGVVERVRQHASVRPDAIAVADGEVRVSYGALAVWADGVAGRLAEAGAGVGSLVAVLGEPGARYVGGVLGVLSAGAAWLPLDVDAPIARQTGLLADSGARFLLAGPGELARAREIAEAYDGALSVLCLDDPFPAIGARAEGLRPLAGGEDDLAYVIYTSGSTGRPKGAMVHRRGMVNHLLAKVEDLAMTQGDVLVHNAPVTFDISVWQMLAALVSGGTTRVVDRVTAADPDALFGVTVSEGVSVLEVVPSLLRAALDAWETAGGFPSLPKLRYLVVTGEALPVDVCRRWFARYPGIPLVNAYGPTECSDDVTHAVLTVDTDLAGSRVPIGRVVRNTRLYVLDDALRPVPVGVPGELYVAGTGVGRGYLADPARTASTFMADPFGPPGERMYRTGDRVVYRPDGQLEFLERRDHQVKIRGRRIELGEIEAALRAVEGVTDAAAQVHTDAATGRKRLVGYLVGPADPARVRTDLLLVLPEYMVPGEYVTLDALPLTPNGKVDRKALTAPEATALTGEGRAPRTPQEETFCAAFADVLDLPSVAADADFFTLGGDSISSIQLVGRARKAGLVITPRDVFLHKTPAALATAAQAAGEAPAAYEPVAADQPLVALSDDELDEFDMEFGDFQ